MKKLIMLSISISVLVAVASITYAATKLSAAYGHAIIYDNIVNLRESSSQITLFACSETTIAPNSALVAEGEHDPTAIEIFARGKKIETPPIIYNGTKMFPLRAIFEAMGASVKKEVGLVKCTKK